jgi:hypothetical protein
MEDASLSMTFTEPLLLVQVLTILTNKPIEKMIQSRFTRTIPQ